LIGVDEREGTMSRTSKKKLTMQDLPHPEPEALSEEETRAVKGGDSYINPLGRKPVFNPTLNPLAVPPPK
jgi:hypothetical protein